MVEIIRVGDEIPAKAFGAPRAKGDFHEEVKQIIEAMEEVPAEIGDDGARQHLEAAFNASGEAEKDAKTASVRASALRRAGFLVVVRGNRVFVMHATDEEKAAFEEKQANKPKRKPRTKVA